MCFNIRKQGGRKDRKKSAHCHLINGIGLKSFVLGIAYKNAWSVKTKLENVHVESFQTRADCESQQQTTKPVLAKKKKKKSILRLVI